MLLNIISSFLKVVPMSVLPVPTLSSQHFHIVGQAEREWPAKGTCEFSGSHGFELRSPKS